MPTFQYRALQSDGKIATGELEAGGRQEAFRQMEGRGLRPITLSERKVQSSKFKVQSSKPAEASQQPTNGEAGKLPKISFGNSNKISARVLENFTRLLSSLLAAGVPLSRALVILRKEASTPVAQQKWKEVHELVIDGMSLADAMARSPDVFPRVYVAMVQAGETGGFLDLVLAQIADFQTRDKELRGKVLAALTYPIILVVLSIAVLIVLLVVFIPNFMPVFSSFGGELPLLTKMILAVSNAVRHYGLFVGVGIFMAVVMARNWFVSEKGKRTWELIILRAPIIGKLSAQFAMARFCRMLGTLLQAGVPLVQALSVARKSIGNQILVDAVSNAIERVKEGAQLGQSLSDCRDLFPGSALEMISVAEESGKLDQELVRLANVTESDLDRNMKTAVSLVEPIMLFCVAALIGILVIGMVVPIFSLQQYIK
jgi:type II secretory pathway component PulF